MPPGPAGPRKRRTRQHVIADQGIHFVEGVVLEEGHTVQRTDHDYGYDLLLFTYDKRGYVEPGFAAIQVKASEHLQVTGSKCVFDLDVRDYNLWMEEKHPVVLILYDAKLRQAFWLHVQSYFLDDSAVRPGRHAKTIRVQVPVAQSLNEIAIERIRSLKSRPTLRILGDDE